jgi:hypothetical protein
MVFFLGILSPDLSKRAASPEAPHKTVFFGGLPDVAMGAVPMSRAEQDACYLAGKSHDADPVGSDQARFSEAFPRFLF